MVTIGSELPPGTLIDRRYQIKRILGRGGFGRTYLASDKRRFGEFCVLKEFVPKNQGDSVVAQKLHELFHREAQILHQLNHPQIPKFFAVFEENNRLFIAQEYIDGKTYWKLLQERQRRGTAFSETEVFAWLRHLLPVLDYLHRRNIVHRDISPDNIMLPRKGRLPVLIDFGVVKQAAPYWYEVSSINPDGSVEASVSVGKLGYAPYEQIRIGQCSPRSDLYALAVTAAVLLTARPPNSLIDPKSLEWKWQSLVSVHPQFARILERMMAEKPQDRYPSARSVLEDLELLKPHLAIEPSDRPTPPLQSDSQHTVPFGQGNTTLFPLSQSRVDRFSRLEPTWLEGVHQPSNSHASPSSSAGSRSAIRSSGAPTSAGYQQQTIRTQKQSTTLTVPALSHTTIRPLADIPATHLNILGKDSSRSVAKKALLLSVLALVPLGGVAVGLQSPYIASLCQSLNNCADDQPWRAYRRLAQQAESAKLFSQQAQTLAELQNARDRLSKAISQLSTLPASNPFFTAAQQQLPTHRDTLQRLDQRLEKESRANQLLQRATAEAKTAEQQTRTAKTQPQLAAARSQWRRVLATLGAIPASTFVADQATARSQQYTTRLQTVDQRLIAIRPQVSPTLAATVAPSAKPAVLPPPVLPLASAAPARPSQAVSPAVPQPQVTPQSQVTPQPQTPPRNIAAKPQPSSGFVPEPELEPEPSIAPTPAPAPAPALPSPNNLPPIAQAQPTASPAAPNRFLSNQILAPMSPSIAAITPGNVDLIASETLNDVSIRLNGARVSSRGTFVANVQVENQSSRPFGFVPLFAEVRDASGQAVPARLRLSSGSADGMVDPGERLQGEVYVLDRFWNNSGSQNLTLVIREGTSGNRNFRVDF